jgi:hypothetical protein
MKTIKLIFAFTLIFGFSLNVFAQERKQAPTSEPVEAVEADAKVVSSLPKCFCCNEKIYQLPDVPPINGGQLICKDLKNIFSTWKCDGASYNWTVNPSGITFTGQGTSQIQIDFGSIPAGTTVVTMTVEIRCGNKVVKNVIKVKVCPQKIIIREGEDALLHGLAGLQGNNYGTHTANVTSNWTFNGTPAVMYSVIKFNIPSGMTASMVSSATLSLREYISAGNGNHAGQYGGATQPTNFVVRRVTSAWGQSTVTFSTMPTTTNTNQVTIPSYSGGSAMDDLDIDVTQLVKDIINSGSNEGFMIRWNDNATNQQYRSRFFGSFECPSIPKRPILTIN